VEPGDQEIPDSKIEKYEQKGRGKVRNWTWEIHVEVCWWTVASAFLLGLMLGPIAHSLMEVVVKWIGGAPQ